MKDAEYLFKQTELERKRIGRGDFNKKRQGGRQVRFPSDYLTKKEKEKMNGEVQTYSMEKPIDWETFKSWPDDLQKAYLLGLREKFGAKGREIGAMLGVSRESVFKRQRELGLRFPRHGGPELDREKWNAFLGKETEEAPELRIEKAPVLPEEEKEEPIKAAGGIVGETPPVVEISTDVLRLSELLMALKGTGAELTIRVNL